MNIMAFSSSKSYGFNYLGYPKEYLPSFFKNKKNIVFIPYAGINREYKGFLSLDAYEAEVADHFTDMGLNLKSIHHGDERKNIENADGIVVGGGSTFKLLKTLQDKNLDNLIREKIMSGTHYTGWSAGCILLCPTIRVTNDMPIVEPNNLSALNILPFHINAHYKNVIDPKHKGETRDVRLNEYLAMYKDNYIVGLREGSYIKVDGDKTTMGSIFKDQTLKIFKFGMQPYELDQGEDLSFLASK